MSRFELYRIAVEQFREQPRTYWVRATFFVTIQSGLVSFFAFQVGDEQRVAPFDFGIALLGLAISLVWLGITLASRGLIAAWRSVVLELESKGYHRETPSNANDDNTVEALGLFQLAAQRGEGSKMGLSITRMMSLLAVVFVGIWVMASLYTADGLFGLALQLPL